MLFLSVTCGKPISSVLDFINAICILIEVKTVLYECSFTSFLITGIFMLYLLVFPFFSRKKFTQIGCLFLYRYIWIIIWLTRGCFGCLTTLSSLPRTDLWYASIWILYDTCFSFKNIRFQDIVFVVHRYKRSTIFHRNYKYK